MHSDVVRVIHELHYAPHAVAVSVLWALLLTGIWAGLARSLLPLVLVIGLAGLWLLTNTSMEGETLLTVLPSHGITQSDLVAPLVVAAALLVRLIRP